MSNRTELGFEYAMGRRRRVGGVPIVVGAGLTVEITDRIPTLDGFGRSPYADVQVGYVVQAAPASNELPIIGIVQDNDAATFARTFEPNQVAPLVFSLRFWNCWPRDDEPLTDVLRPPDPPIVGPAPGAPLTNRIYLRSFNDQPVTVWLNVEIPTAEVRTIPDERPKWWAVQHNQGPRYLFGFVEVSMAPQPDPSGIDELTGEWPTRAQIQREGLIFLRYNYDPALAGVGVWCAVTDNAGGADPENRTAYPPNRSPVSMSVHDFSGTFHVGPFPPRENAASTTLEDGTRVFLVNQDGAVTYLTSRYFAVSTLNWP